MNGHDNYAKFFFRRRILPNLILGTIIIAIMMLIKIISNS